MGKVLVTGPTLEPVTMIEVKAHCRVDIDDDDGLLAGYILAARMHLETETRRAFMTQTWDYTLDNEWLWEWDRRCQKRRYRIALPKAPLQSVTSISYVDSNGTTQTLAADQYRVVDASNRLAEAWIEPAYGVTWPSVRDQAATITVRMVCGYTGTNAFPEELRQALLLLIGHWYENRETVNVGNITSELPFSVASLVFPFRLFY
jgi:uncharacterized phiE125 gp8 family phage protein